MYKPDLAGWASIAEIVGTIAIVISLVFVILSVNRNTDVLRTANDAYIHERADSQLADIAAQPNVAVRYASASFGLEFADPTDAQMFFTEMRDMNMWEATYYWYLDGFFSERQWTGWDKAFSSTVRDEFREEWWRATRKSASDDFAAHVDAVYARD